jgi:hypothetical protein
LYYRKKLLLQILIWSAEVHLPLILRISAVKPKGNAEFQRENFVTRELVEPAVYLNFDELEKFL